MKYSFNMSFLINIVILICITSCVHFASPIQQEGYHNDQQIAQIITQVTANGLFTQKTCNNTELYKYLEYGNQSSQFHAFIVCNLHAKEIISTEICLEWLQQNKNGSQLLDKYFIRIFYNANVMRQQVISGQDQCIRKNENGVDGNRNFPEDFNHFNVSSDNQTYGGEKPLDQPLSQCLNSLFLQKKPTLYLDIHSGQNNTFLYQPTNPQDNYKELLLLNDIKTDIFDDQDCKIITVYDDGDEIDGQIFADIKIRLSVKYSFLIEVYQANSKHCFQYFNPSGKTKKKVITTYIQVINEMLQKVIELQQQKE